MSKEQERKAKRAWKRTCQQCRDTDGSMDHVEAQHVLKLVNLPDGCDCLDWTVKEDDEDTVEGRVECERGKPTCIGRGVVVEEMCNWCRHELIREDFEESVDEEMAED